MFAINYLDLNESIKADRHFNNCFQGYLQPPFLIWREVAVVHEKKDEGRDETESDRGSAGDNNNKCPEEKEEAGAVNFLTGAGGFLQSILFGYAGLRVLADRLVINEPHLMPATNELIINGIKYRGLSIDLIVVRGGREDQRTEGGDQEQDHNNNNNRFFSLRFRECTGGRNIVLIVNDTEINAVCRAQPSKWCKYIYLNFIIIEFLPYPIPYRR